jgi:TRAP-type uncharacterized transport system substrate-binding protein
MFRKFLGFVLLAFLFLAALFPDPKWTIFIPSAHAQSAPPSLNSMMPQSQNQMVTLNMACGDLGKSNCAQVLPKIKYYSIQQNVNIQPVSSTGSVESALGVCGGEVQAAVGQADAFSSVSATTQCTAAFQIVGKALYPYQAYLVVAASNPAGSLRDLVNNTPMGKSVRIADGKVGSGGKITFQNILNTDATFKQKISERTDDYKSALEEMLDGQLDGYFVMDAPNSPLVDSIESQTDKNGKPLYKFIAVNPSDDFFAITDNLNNGKPLYQSTPLAFGNTTDSGFLGIGGKNTVEVNAEIIVNSNYNSGITQQYVDILRSAADSADADITAVTNTPSSWTPIGQ